MQKHTNWDTYRLLFSELNAYRLSIQYGTYAVRNAYLVDSKELSKFDRSGKIRDVQKDYGLSVS